jgi:hypothetical protein
LEIERWVRNEHHYTPVSWVRNNRVTISVGSHDFYVDAVPKKQVER